MRGAWLDENDEVGRYARRHDGAIRNWHDPELDDPDWTPPSQRGGLRRGSQARGEIDSTDDLERTDASGKRSAQKSAGQSSSAHLHQPQRPPEAPGWTSFLIGAGALCAVGVIVAGAVGSSETRAAALVMVVLGLILMPVLRRLSEGRPDVKQILYAGLGMKLTMTLVRFWLSSGGYYKNSDAYGYDFYGRQIATDYLRHGHMPNWKSYTGTAFIRLVTGFVYTVVPASMLAAFFVFATFSFVGTLFFWRAVKLFAPPPTDRPYLMMLMFIPSFIYWPSALGKEAFIILTLGAATYGFARLLTGSLLTGCVLLGLGIYGMTMVRPHVGLAMMIGLTVATIFAKQQGRRGGLVVLGIALFVLSGFVLSKANAFFQSDVTSASNVTSQLTDAGKRTTQGGSEFKPSPVNPANFPYATMTVLLRPFPWEASSAPELATALESVAIGWLIVKGVKQIRGRIRRDNPLAILALVVTIVFVILFWNFANFGILARQRTQLAPFVFMLLAMPVTLHKEKKDAKRKRRSGQSAWDQWDATLGEA